jgi:predicted acetyltransferase
MTEMLTYRKATQEDVHWLAEMNQQLIRDMGHRNPMTVPELEMRMDDWLAEVYEAIIFEQGPLPVAYALFRQDAESIYLRQLFVVRDFRRQGIGKQAMNILLSDIWPHDWKVVVEVLTINHTGYLFWKSLGFQDYSITLELMPDNRPDNFLKD